MSRFHFRLESMLRLRLSQRDQRRVELADALSHWQQSQQLLQQVDDELAAARADRTARPGRIDVDQVLAADCYAATLRARREQVEIARAEASARVAQRRTALVEADRQVRTLEALRAKQLDRFQIEARRLETRVLDELGAGGAESTANR